MRRLPAAIAVLAIALIGAVLAPAQASARPDVQFGIEQFGNMENPVYTDDFQNIMKRDGATVMRYVVRWDWVARACDPATRGNPADMNNPCYSWTYLDEIVRKADAKGLDVLFSIYGTPGWKFNGKENYTGNTEAQFASFVNDYALFSRAVATRYDGRHGQPRVDQITIWNEPNGSFFEPRFINGETVGPARYARLYDAAARQIKAADATLRVGVGPTAPHSPALPPYRFASIVLPELQRMGSPIDAWAHNAYTGRQSPMHNYSIKPPYIGLGNVDDLTALMDQYPVASGKPLWITEFGYQTSGGQKAIELSEHPPLVADALYFAWQHSRIETFIWYQLHDDPATDPYNFMSGLYLELDQKCGGTLCAKPGAAMFRHTIYASPRASNGVVTLWAQGRSAPAKTKLYVRRPGQGWRAYVNGNSATTGTVFARMNLPLGTIVMACDIACGPSETISATASGGGTSGTKRMIKRLRSVTLNRKQTIRRGIAFRVNCTGNCIRVRSRLMARGRVSGIKAARTRMAVVGHARVRKVGAQRSVHLRLKPSARRDLSRVKRGMVIIRTYVTYKGGKVAVSDRYVRLR